MQIVCDIEKSVGYWVRQVRQNGETIAVKVPYDFPRGLAELNLGLATSNRSSQSTPAPAA
jgi:hypothetical protein